MDKVPLLMELIFHVSHSLCSQENRLCKQRRTHWKFIRDQHMSECEQHKFGQRERVDETWQHEGPQKTPGGPGVGTAITLARRLMWSSWTRTTPWVRQPPLAKGSVEWSSFFTCDLWAGAFPQPWGWMCASGRDPWAVHHSKAVEPTNACWGGGDRCRGGK